MTSQPPKNLATFQQQFGQYLRDPVAAPLPTGIPEKPATIYQQLVFDNYRGFIDSCFPICRRLTEEQQWLSLIRLCLRENKSTNPMFNSIPAQFLATLATAEHLPPWYQSLAHYEWIELAIDIQVDSIPQTISVERLNETLLTPATSLQLLPNPTLQNLRYEWPVHQISQDFQPEAPIETYLLVYRNHAHQSNFIEINSATAQLISCLTTIETIKNHSLLESLAIKLGFELPEQLYHFLVPLLTDLIYQEALYLKEQNNDESR
ncbi:DNA-binding domain-containing protein [Suttonella ornithocola]|uniref:Uncharacterized protein conserved in bacteria n=1 Tax=Suttonella ornithocola TaxID=279832 RepID=A0A380MP75_9GAMM|nr:putative DNA-binding domain-containing protein [Suttonella ornithocola]SUO94405.1 Uncharacterized protein conserved in bacteria [Suttonella ornithocola]